MSRTAKAPLRRVLGLVTLSALASLPAVGLLAATQFLRSPGGEMPVADSRIDRVFEWVKAVETHRPGTTDEAFASIRAWSREDLAALVTDATSLLAIIADPRQSDFYVQLPSGRRLDIPYTQAQLARLRQLACVAGALRVAWCETVRTDQRNDPVIARLATDAASSRRAGDRNYFVRRAAMLHTDIATLSAPTFVAGTGDSGAARQPVGIYEGIIGHIVDTSAQWEPARAMLDWVVRDGDTKPAPDRDAWVRGWYVATAAWMQGHKRYRTEHMDRAREIFPNDPDLLFLSGCQHEAYGSPEVQDALGDATRRGFRTSVTSEARELRQAERFFQRALAARPDMDESRVHLAHVQIQQRRYSDALATLRAVRAGHLETRLQYYVDLFTGRANEGAGNVDAARAAYERAAELFPSAQSPRIAVSELAFTGGDRAAATTAFDRLLAVSRSDTESDPWWTYGRSAVRDPDLLLDRLRRQLLGGVS